MDSDIPCAHCRRPIINPSGTMNGWMHEDTYEYECEPRFASPDFINPNNIRRD